MSYTPFWDRPGVLEDNAAMEASEPAQPSFLTASSRHGGNWLFTLRIVSCGLRLDNKAASCCWHDAMVGSSLSTPLSLLLDSRMNRQSSS